MDLHLREALRLDPAVTWPPNYYALLGLPPGAVAPAAVEAAVLDRMERLRAYQLAHPEAVTEAMNLLAQALVALSAAPSLQGAGTRELRPDGLNVAGDETYALAEAKSVKRPAALRRDRPALVIPVPPPFVAATPRRFRERVRRLAAVRRLLRDWDVAGGYFTSTRDHGRAERVAVLAALWRIAATADDWLPDDGPGGAVLALARGPATLAALAELTDARRGLLADDWRAGRRVLFEQSLAARSLVGRRGRWPTARRWARRSRRDIPIAILAACAAVTVPVVLVRFLTG